MMKMQILFKILLVATFTILGISICFSQSTVTVIIKNIEKPEGKIELGLYDQAKYWLEDTGQYREDIISCTDSPSMTYTFEDVAYGTYGFSLYHDENGNGKMDFRTWIPKEPYGFSNNPRAKWSKPSFKKCSFVVNEPEVTIEVDLQDW